MEPHLEAYRTIDSFTDLIEPRWQPPLITKRATLKDAQIEQIMMWTSFATERSLNDVGFGDDLEQRLGPLT